MDHNTTAILFTKISSLPDDLKTEVTDFVDFLLSKIKNDSVKKEREFGCMKGLIKMREDFDEPLEEFKEYM